MRHCYYAGLLFFLVTRSQLYAQDNTPLPGTKPLTWQEEDLSERLMNGAHQFVERKIDESLENRGQFWNYDFSSMDAFKKSIEPNRHRLREIIGAVDPRLQIRLQRWGDDDNPALVAETATYRIFQVRWPVLDGVYGEGLYVEPLKPRAACVVAIPDADQTPEQLMGLGDGVAAELQFARRLAENGVRVIIPTLIDRRKLETDDERLKRSDQTHREWIYRQAFHMGRHVIGYEVQQVLSAVDWFRRQSEDVKIGVAGYAEGGLIAFYASALDTRIDVALVSGYFDSRQDVWTEPIYRNVFGLIREFGDAELSTLIAPRPLIIEYSDVPSVKGHKGELKTPPLSRLIAEIERLPKNDLLPRPDVLSAEGQQTIGPGSLAATQLLAKKLGVNSDMPISKTIPVDQRRNFSVQQRQSRVTKGMEHHVQQLVRQSEHVRDNFFLYNVMPELAGGKWSTNKRHPINSPEKFIDGARRFRQIFHEEAMGQFDEKLVPPNPRTRKILQHASWTAYDVVLDVWPEVFAWGVLVLPNDIQPGEKRPVVVCQHGRQGVPRDTIDYDKTAYNNFAAKLAERGFITFAPHNLYRGEDRYRWLDRKSNTVKATMFSFIIAQHDQILQWLDSRPEVDGDRIAFYGLSYGGETAMRVPSILEKYCLSICSGDFNQWTRKVAATDQPFTFMRTIEWEMPYWNLGHTFDYAEMAYLMVPRPFMAERGHWDLVGRDRWVAHEYAKVRWLYTQLGLSGLTEMEYFQGGHSINGEGTFEFLHNHLKWPRRSPR